MGIRYSSKMKYNLKFLFTVEGKVDESDIIGALLTLSAAYYPAYGIVKLQNQSKLGKVKISKKDVVRDKQDRTEGSLQIPLNLDRADTSIFVSVIENITRIKLFGSKINLHDVEDLERGNSAKFLTRAIEVYNGFFDNEGSVSADDIRKTLLEMTSAKKAVTCGKHTIGATFTESEQVIVVEGRADVLALSECGISNTFALNGWEFDEDTIIEFLGSKTITLFRDGDEGGREIEKKLAGCVPITYVVQTPHKVSVEDLSKTEIINYLKTRKLVK
jgi:DNA primase